MVTIGEHYKHFKGKEYLVIAVGKDSDTLEDVVVYQGQYNSKEFGDKPVWVRTLKDFISEKVFKDGSKVRRFMLIE
jgi:hypothetical protein